MTPSEGIEPPFQEPESYVLSVAPRGHIMSLTYYIKALASLQEKTAPHLDAN